MKLEDHPTVKWYRERSKGEVAKAPLTLEAKWLKQLVLDAGADDVGIVEIDRDGLADHRDDILRAYPKTKALIPLSAV
jgi:hypothetical protein